jgi:hypothetical protein
VASLKVSAPVTSPAASSEVTGEHVGAGERDEGVAGLRLEQGTGHPLRLLAVRPCRLDVLLVEGDLRERVEGVGEPGVVPVCPTTASRSS